LYEPFSLYFFINLISNFFFKKIYYSIQILSVHQISFFFLEILCKVSTTTGSTREHYCTQNTTEYQTEILIPLHYCFFLNRSSLCAITVTISSTSHLIIPFSVPSNFFKKPYTLLLPVLSALFFLNTAQAKQLLQDILNPGKVFILHLLRLVGVSVFHLQLLLESF